MSVFSSHSLLLCFFGLTILSYRSTVTAFDFSRCHSCSTQKEIRCIVQHLGDSCMKGRTVDQLSDGRKWPGPVRNLDAKIKKRNGTQFVYFTWKSPFDSSIEDLEGFEINVFIQAEYSSFIHCFFANITNKRWTELIEDRYNVVFHFDCIQSVHAVRVTALVNSVPKPHINVSRQTVTLDIPEIKNYWRPTLDYIVQHQEANVSLFVTFHSEYDRAVYYELILLPQRPFHVKNGADRPVHRQVIKAICNNVTFHNIPCNKNFSLAIRPLDATGRELHYYLYVDAYTGECPVNFHHSLSRRDLAVMIALPTTFLLAIIVVVCISSRGIILVIPVYYPDNIYITKIVDNIRAILVNNRGQKVIILSDDEARKVTEESTRKTRSYDILIILTKHWHNFHSDKKNKFSISTNNNNTHLLNLLQKFKATNNTIRQLHTVFLFWESDKADDIDTSFAPEKSLIYALADVSTTNDNQTLLKCNLREYDLNTLVRNLQRRTLCVPTILTNTQVIVDLKQNLFQCYLRMLDFKDHAIVPPSVSSSMDSLVISMETIMVEIQDLNERNMNSHTLACEHYVS